MRGRLGRSARPGSRTLPSGVRCAPPFARASLRATALQAAAPMGSSATGGSYRQPNRLHSQPLIFGA
ncbi:MAG: hypothetical protein MUF62_07230, partial [Chitinophagaceae bacterium]|nr:hypothetical protein [Chitinophagaceae bacterium]